MKERYAELDLLRTLAIVAMVIYHLCYDLQMFYGWQLGMFEYPAWNIFEKMIAGLFLLLVGVSFAISWSRGHRYRRYLKRGLGLLACAALVSIVTYAMNPETYVRFGILHLIAVAILVLPCVAGLKEWSVIPGLMIVALHWMIPAVSSGTELLLPLGVLPPDMATVDYFPVIPWLGIVLIGYALGYFIYVRHSSRRSSLTSLSSSPSLPSSPSFFSWPGRHALLIYLLHQPMLLGLLSLAERLGFL